jgi:hypothetical protein
MWRVAAPATRALLRLLLVWQRRLPAGTVVVAMLFFAPIAHRALAKSSLHLSCCGWLRRPLPAGELKR